ncbi:pimeloyl-ACP methyl ester carboxylesterase [Sphingomonas endophytica]|uniref:Pimeloyl-ACP methyl ester carboxylesterase n=1 Tax=Sphingomonas endophytica TaxID=869719 RepID=A0A7X0J994_9SPHN|nr:alpha/beta hydrolase [Sphingomonas endophytica]MBB6503444.1 pimeloyl-ACP methyl ester carboxylesterase [Sphingomonas endophytica]
MRRASWITIGVGALLLSGFAYQHIAERIDAVRHPAPGRLVAVGDHRLHLWCAGPGSPTVLLLSGDGTPSVTMYAEQRRIAADTRVCSYDRAGLGWSDPAPQPMGLRGQVDDLERLLARGGVDGPLVLVPESGGNVIALAFFRRAPQRVVGMVMVDGSEPSLWFRGSPDEFPMLRLTDPLWQAGWRLGIIRLILPFAVPSWVEALPPDLRGQFDAVWSRPMPGQVRDPVDRWEQTPVGGRPRAVSGMLGDRPLVVIRHGLAGGMGVPEKYKTEWPAAQAWLARLSRDSEMLVATRNHHPIAEENPALVSAQVRRVVARVQAGK